VRSGANGANRNNSPDSTPTPRYYYAGNYHGIELGGGLFGLVVGEAGTAGGTAEVFGRVNGHLLEVVLAHESDEDAANVVVARDAWDHCYFRFGVGGLFGE
jgi:hypothetical protein